MLINAEHESSIIDTSHSIRLPDTMLQHRKISKGEKKRTKIPHFHLNIANYKTNGFLLSKISEAKTVEVFNLGLARWLSG